MVDPERRVREPVPERPERRDRSIDVVALRLGVAAGRMMAVGERHLPDRAWNRHGELAARVGDAGESSGDRVGALVAGDPGEQDRGAVAGGPFDGERPAADDDEHDRRPGGDDGLEKLLLAAQEPERRSGHGTPLSSSRRSARNARRGPRSRRRRREPRRPRRRARRRSPPRSRCRARRLTSAPTRPERSASRIVRRPDELVTRLDDGAIAPRRRAHRRRSACC